MHTSTSARSATDLTADLCSSHASDAAAGGRHTLGEIMQQPETWRVTGKQMAEALPALSKLIEPGEPVIFTGSGSSEYAGNCACPAFQKHLQVTAMAVGSGALLTDGTAMLPTQRPALMISFARSGDSPESAGALAEILHADPAIKQLAITCNADGRLAKIAAKDSRLDAVVLDDRTNDRSLVMTSSFTNMVLAAQALAWKDDAAGYVKLTEILSRAAESMLSQAFDRLPSVAEQSFHRAFYLASPNHYGAAREAALKMTEMTAGRVVSVSETYLGLRHGPMSAIDPNTLIVCFLSSDPKVRAYECDLIEELMQKKLGLAKVLVGSDVPRALVADGDVVIESAGFVEAGDADTAILHVLIGQVLGFLRCLHEGLKPDAPSESGVIHRVVQQFRLQGASSLSV